MASRGDKHDLPLGRIKVLLKQDSGSSDVQKQKRRPIGCLLHIV
jgi:hypothetical protein